MLNDFRQHRCFHLVGIAGSGMTALAELLLAQGFSVSGSDSGGGAKSACLEGKGARVYRAHLPEHVAGADALVRSTAIPENNPEVVEAARRGIPIVHRSELLAELMRFRKGIAVAGSHGKSTISAMLEAVLTGAGLDPTVAIGARMKATGTNSRLGQGEYFVAEADESDRSLLNLMPLYAVVSSLDLDHTDTYQDLQDLKRTFRRFLEKIPFYGLILASGDDAELRDLRRIVHHPMLTYGLVQDADFRVAQVSERSFGMLYTLFRQGTRLGEVSLQMAGRHNVLNSAAAAGLGLLLGVPFESIQYSLGNFRGIERRLEYKGVRQDIIVLDDYAHHPTEIREALEACRPFQRPVSVVYQPHRYTRTGAFMDQFARAFDEVSRLYLLDIYSAGEQPIEGVSSRRLARKIEERRAVSYVESVEELLDALERDLLPGDLLVTMGAGDVGTVGEKFLERQG